MSSPPTPGPVLTGLQRLERELIVRDFLTVWNAGGSDELGAFLHSDVVFRPALGRVARGRPAVIAMCRDIQGRFQGFRVSIVDLAVSSSSVLVEQEIELEDPDCAPCTLMSFASYRFEGYQISEWRQLSA